MEQIENRNGQGMVFHNKIASLLYKLALAFLSGLGLFLNSGLLAGSFNPQLLYYFTILSNYMVFIFTVFSVLGTIRSIQREGINGNYTLLPRFKGGFVMAILTTFIIYQFVLVPQRFSMGVDNDFRWGNALVHHIVPLMMLADWALFDQKGKIKPQDPIIWCLVPLAYLIFSLLRAETGSNILMTDSRYPYFFIDVDLLGARQVFINVLLFAVYYLIQGYIFFLVDKGLGIAAGKRADARLPKEEQTKP